MTDDNIAVQLATIRGQIEALDDRLGVVEYWVKEQAPRVITFMDKHDAVEAERDRTSKLRHDENIAHMDDLDLRISQRNLTLTVTGVIISFLALVCAVCMIYLAVRAAHAQLDPSKLLKSDQHLPALSMNETQISHR